MQKAVINSKMLISTFNRYYRYKTVLTASRLITHKAENVSIMTLYLGMYCCLYSVLSKNICDLNSISNIKIKLNFIHPG